MKTELINNVAFKIVGAKDTSGDKMLFWKEIPGGNEIYTLPDIPDEIFYNEKSNFGQCLISNSSNKVYIRVFQTAYNEVENGRTYPRRISASIDKTDIGNLSSFVSALPDFENNPIKPNFRRDTNTSTKLTEILISCIFRNERLIITTDTDNSQLKKEVYRGNNLFKSELFSRVICLLDTLQPQFLRLCNINLFTDNISNKVFNNFDICIVHNESFIDQPGKHDIIKLDDLESKELKHQIGGIHLIGFMKKFTHDYSVNCKSLPDLIKYYERLYKTINDENTYSNEDALLIFEKYKLTPKERKNLLEKTLKFENNEQTLRVLMEQEENKELIDSDDNLCQLYFKKISIGGFDELSFWLGEFSKFEEEASDKIIGAYGRLKHDEQLKVIEEIKQNSHEILKKKFVELWFSRQNNKFDTLCDKNTREIIGEEILEGLLTEPKNYKKLEEEFRAQIRSKSITKGDLINFDFIINLTTGKYESTWRSAYIEAVNNRNQSDFPSKGLINGVIGLLQSNGGQNVNTEEQLSDILALLRICQLEITFWTEFDKNLTKIESAVFNEVIGKINTNENLADVVHSLTLKCSNFETVDYGLLTEFYKNRQLKIDLQKIGDNHRSLSIWEITKLLYHLEANIDNKDECMEKKLKTEYEDKALPIYLIYFQKNNQKTLKEKEPWMSKMIKLMNSAKKRMFFLRILKK